MSGDAVRINVAVGVIKDSNGRVLISRRPQGKHLAGLWEFPGGKIEIGESTQYALVRECQEELGIIPTQMHKLIQIEYQYPEKHVWLDVQLVTAFDGTPFGREQQQIEWVAADALTRYHFPPANQPIVTAVNLPRIFLITGPFETVDDFTCRLNRAVQNGITHIQIRAPILDEKSYLNLVTVVKENFCQHPHLHFFVNSSAAVFSRSGFQHYHLTSDRLKLSESRADIPVEGLLSASCHSLEELERAQTLGVDFVFYSPILATSSHPSATPVGWEGLRLFCQRAKVPVFALGGLAESDLLKAIENGAQGIAAISAYWNY